MRADRCEAKWDSPVEANPSTCYRFSGVQTLSWNDAANECRASGASLVSLTDDSEEVRGASASTDPTCRRVLQTNSRARRPSCARAPPTTPVGTSASSTTTTRSATAGLITHRCPASSRRRSSCHTCTRNEMTPLLRSSNSSSKVSICRKWDVSQPVLQQLMKCTSIKNGLSRTVLCDGTRASFICKKGGVLVIHIFSSVMCTHTFLLNVFPTSEFNYSTLL